MGRKFELKNIIHKKFLVQENFWVKNFFWVKKILGKIFFWGHKNILIEKLF